MLIRRATVPALDAVRFVRMAQSIDRHGLLPTLQTEQEQPLFAVWVWAVHGGVEQFAGESATSWATAVQVAAAISLVMTVVPLYFIVLRLAGPAAPPASGRGGTAWYRVPAAPARPAARRGGCPGESAACRPRASWPCRRR